MTIFHVLKYPVTADGSIIVMCLELNSLKKNLPSVYNEWFRIMCTKENCTKEYAEKAALLRKLLYEYEG